MASSIFSKMIEKICFQDFLLNSVSLYLIFDHPYYPNVKKDTIEAKQLVEASKARYGGNWIVFASESDEYCSLWLSSEIENLNLAYTGVNWLIARY
jgi:hypothetical protein